MNKISHEGIVQAVDDHGVKVRIVQSSACASCKVASHCSAVESKEKVVDVRCTNAMEKYQTGDRVTISMSTKNGRDAVVMGFILPFLILVSILVLCLFITGDEGIAAVVSIGSLLPYYLLLWVFRDKMSKRFSFHIDELYNN